MTAPVSKLAARLADLLADLAGLLPACEKTRIG
jgi:hypothetical protein